MAANFRILYDNAANRATLTASSQASASLGVSNLLTDIKSQVLRMTATSGFIKLDFPSVETIGVVALAYSNLTAITVARVRCTNEAAATNLLTYSETFSNVSWTATNTTFATGVADPAGGTAALTMTAGATAPRQLKQTLAAGVSAINTSSIWLRRRTGAGNVTLWSPDGAVPLVISGLPGTWTRYSVPNLSAAVARAFLLEMATAGDAIDIAFSQLETGAVATSYYPTTGAVATRPVGYIDSWQSYTLDTGNIAGVPDPGAGMLGRSGANLLAYGGGTTARAWFTPTPSRAVRIDVSDPTNPAGYLEAGRAIAGNYWEGVRNVDYGAALTIVDTTKNFRSDAGDLLSDIGTRHRKLTLPLSNLSQAERATLFSICWGNGLATPVFASIFPNSTDPALEQSHQGWFKLMTSPAMAMPSFLQYASSLEIEEV